jgi:hypothetical protein
MPSGSEGRLSPLAPANVYNLRRPVTIGNARALELEFRLGPLATDKAPEVDILMRGGKGAAPLASEHLVLRDKRTRFVVAFPAGSRLSAISLALVSPAPAPAGAPGGKAQASPADSGAFVVELASVKDIALWSGIDRRGGNVRISSGTSVYRKSGELHLVLPSPLAAGDGKTSVLLGYGKGQGERHLRLEADGKTVFSMRMRPDGLVTSLPASFFPASARSLELVLPASAEFSVFSAGRVDPADAELADFGRILRAGPEDPSADYDLYRWDMLPSVLIFDFRDYATQDAYLKRLAFFVEKEGFRGRLAKDDEIRDLHGWNAHDYRPEDLAAFFEAARSSGFALNPKELAFRDLLASRGVIDLDGGRYVAGKGAFISISRESVPYQRTQLLTHESTHAIFFCDADYRGFVQQTWSAIPGEEKWFWKLLFGWMAYDTGDAYLMANEYQAYLIQQVLPLTHDYFTKIQVGRLTEKHPELVDPINAYMLKFGDSFEKRADALDAWLGAKYGFRAGRGASF